jgi:hypothetical protein
MPHPSPTPGERVGHPSFCWLCSYLVAWGKSGLSYHNNPYEVDANRMQDRISADLLNRYGISQVCTNVLQ